MSIQLSIMDKNSNAGGRKTENTYLLHPLAPGLSSGTQVLVVFFYDKYPSVPIEPFMQNGSLLMVK